jgi:hypothetical protein
VGRRERCDDRGVAGGLRKVGGTYGPAGTYAASGTLAGISGPGRRTVTQLELRRLGPDEDLSVLAAFAQLERLELHHVNGLDLAPLAGLPLTHLSILDATALDLAPLAGLPALQWLTLLNLADCTVAPLTLAPSLVTILVVNDDPGLTGDPVRDIVGAIEWSALPALRSLNFRVGGLYEMRPIELDLGFLRDAPQLTYLDAHTGLRHAGPGPSPFEPPFHGLPKHLTWLRIDADDPEPTRAALREYLGIDPADIEAGPSVYQRYPFEAPPPPWTITACDGTWITYGSLFREEQGESNDTEYDALRRAKGRLRAADAALLRRLDFDPESAGTGIAAEQREDLEAALRILGLRA